MVNNQKEFNENFSKETKEIKLKHKTKFQGQLVIEDYSELEKIYLRDIKNIEKIELKNLPQLQECTIWNCGVKELTIENCPQIKKLNIENNLLTDLKFVEELKNLEELKVDDNIELTKILEPYQGDWKNYKKIIQGSNKDAQELLRLSQQKYDELKKTLKGVMVSLSEEAKQELTK